MKASSAFRAAFALKSLRSLYYEFVRYRGTVGLDGINSAGFEKRIDSHVRMIHARVRGGTYRFTPYRAVLASKGPHKPPRILSIPTVRDKLVLRASTTVLREVFAPDLLRKPLHSVIDTLFRQIRSNNTTARYDWFLRFDVENYYPSIEHRILFRELFRKIRKPQIRTLLREAVANPTRHGGEVLLPDRQGTGLPQGLPISNILADIYLDRIDREFGSRQDIAYFRYADDFLVLCTKEAAEPIVRDLRTALGRRSLKIPELSDGSKKSAQGSLKDEFEFLGYRVSPASISVRERSTRALRDSLIAVLTSHKYSKKKRPQLVEWTLNLRITGCVFNDTRYGWMHYFSQMTDETLLHSLDCFVRKQLRRFGIDGEKIAVKRFVRAWHEINRNSRSSSYIPKFDLYSPVDKRKCIKIVRDRIDVGKMTDEEIDFQFRRIVYRSIQELEKDLRQIS